METELKALNRPIELLSHKLTYFLFKKTNIQHLCVNNELLNNLKNKKFKERKLIYHQNGYLSPKNNNMINHDIIKSAKAFQNQHNKIGIFVGSGRPWHGLADILELFSTKKECGLIIIGPYKQLNSEQCLQIKHANSATLEKLFEHCHFGISNFRWDLLNIHEGSPLKSRQYLCNGLPILTTYKDSATDYPELRSYIFNQKENTKAIEEIIQHNFSKEEIKDKATKYLSWNSVYKNLNI